MKKRSPILAFTTMAMAATLFSGCIGGAGISIALNVKGILLDSTGKPVGKAVSGTACATVRTDDDEAQGSPGMQFCQDVTSDGSGIFHAFVEGSSSGTPKTYKAEFKTKDQVFEGEITQLNPNFSNGHLTGNMTAQFTLTSTVLAQRDWKRVPSTSFSGILESLFAPSRGASASNDDGQFPKTVSPAFEPGKYAEPSATKEIAI
ncbi:MAG: hypothetical protein HY074_15385 [Deltaproteobacteria bacterium]|nr:hypothetical protein [Deltaproteobacteria bacterium]